MKHRPALYALERLHAELGGKITDNKREAKRLAQAMIHVEAVLKMLEPGYDVRPHRRSAAEAEPVVQAGHGIPARP